MSLNPHLPVTNQQIQMQTTPSIQKIEFENSPLIGQESFNRWEKCNKIIAIGACLCSTAAVVASSFFLNRILNDFSHNCKNLWEYSWDFPTCRAPYEKDLLFYHVILAAATSVLGYVGQHLWELKPKELIQKSEMETETSEETHKPKGYKTAIAYLQTRFGYEISLILGYLYSGLWIKTNTQKELLANYSCRSTAIGLAGFALGMYIRIQNHNIKKMYAHKNVDLDFQGCKKEWKWILLSGLWVSGMVFGYIYAPSFPYSTPYSIVRLISVMLASRPFGYYLSSCIESLKKERPRSFKDKCISVISTTFSFQFPLALLGYLIFSRKSASASSSIASSLGYILHANPFKLFFGMALIGLAQGIKDHRFRPFEYKKGELTESLSETERNRRCLKNNWQTIALLIVGTVCSIFAIPKCDLYAISCPFNFDLSGTYLVLDGRGLGIAILSGIGNFWLRKLFEQAMHSQNENLKRIGRGYINISDRFQFDLLSIIPFAALASGAYFQEKKAYVSGNPIPALIMLGVTLGIYKHQAQSLPSNYFLPGFTNTAVLPKP